jgi:hypothetical protein
MTGSREEVSDMDGTKRARKFLGDLQFRDTWAQVT